MKKAECVFCKIVQGTALSHKIWEDESHLAFPTIFPNTEGAAVLITKTHYPSYAFDLPDDILTDLMLAAKKVGKLLDSKFRDVGRTGLVLEGFGVDHMHVKLFPLHGTKTKAWKPILSEVSRYFAKYHGHITSHGGPRVRDGVLSELAFQIREGKGQI